MAEEKQKTVRVEVLKGTIRANKKEWGPGGVVAISEKAAISLSKLGRVRETGADVTKGKELPPAPVMSNIIDTK